MRAMWKGSLELGKRSIALKLYAAIEDAAVHFHLLHARDQVRVEQRIVDPTSGEIVPAQAIRKGFALGPSRFVVVEEDELEATKPNPSRAIEIESSLALDAIPAAHFERPYFLGPDGESEAYFALAEALAQRQRQCLVRFVMRTRAYRAALRSDGERLSLITLRSRDEVLAAPELEHAARREASRQELALAEQLVSSLAADFDPRMFRSQYREKVREFVARKAAGKPIALHKPRTPKPPVTSLANALKASVARARPAAHKHAQKEKQSA